MVTKEASPHRVLVLADQPLVVDLISLTLNHGTFVTRDVPTLDEAKAAAAEWQPHVAVIDMDLGGPASLRPLNAPTGAGAVPILALTRRGDLKRKLEAFDQGVDDVLTVPFSPEELLARVVVITRRTYGSGSGDLSMLQLGEIQFDIVNRQVIAGGEALHLTALDQSLLYLLAANAGRVVSRDEILDAVWGPDFIAESNIVDRHIRSLRAKLQNDWRRPRYIATVPGRGYRFIATPQATAVIGRAGRGAAGSGGRRLPG
jgi:two-component system, OmpR family, KDP operon response regulator KdpE